MGEKMPQFRLHKQKFFWVRLSIAALYAGWAMAFIAFSLRINPTDATSGIELSIPSIELFATAQPVELKDHHFPVPDTTAGVYQSAPNKVFIMGHKSTIFTHLAKLQPDESIYYDNQEYRIKSIRNQEKSTIDMSQILADEDTPTIILMTCSGQQISETDYTHRIIVTATR